MERVNGLDLRYYGRGERTKHGVGYSLRFPRLKEWNRMDKGVEQITSVGEIGKLF